MKKILNLLVVVLLCVFCLIGCKSNDPEFYNDLGDKDQETLTVVLSPDYAPYEYIRDLKKSGYLQYGGADVEVAKYIAKKLGMKLKIKSAAFDVCPTEVNSGKADVSISGFSWTPSRAQNYELSDTYFAEGDGAQQILIKKADAGKYKSLSDLNNSNVKVAAQGGTIQDDLVTEYLPNATKENFTNIEQAIQTLISGKYDAIALSEYVIDVWVSAKNELQELGENFDVPTVGNVVLAKKGNTELINKINGVIAQIVKENLYTTWMEKAEAEAEKLKLDME